MANYSARVDSADSLNHHLSAIELIPSEDAKSSKKSSFFTRFKSLFCFNQTVHLEHAFPASLQLLVYYFRCLSASFSGCLFIKKPAPINRKQSRHPIDDQVFSLDDWKYAQIAKRLLMITLNLLTVVYFATPLIAAVLDARRETGNSTASNQPPKQEEIDMKGFMEWLDKGTNKTIDNAQQGLSIAAFGKIIFDVARGHQSQEDMSELKPILRMIMQWLVYVYMLNGLVSSIYNLLFGGSFLRHLMSIREFSVIDRGHSLAAILIGADLAVVVAIKLGVIWAYQQDQIRFILNDGGPDEDEFAKFSRMMMTLNFVFETVLSLIQTLFLTMNTLLFVYSMVMFRWAIEQLQNDVKRATELDELQLSLLKTRLFRLNEAFKTTIRYFSVPITLDLLACTYMLIGSACFLIINQDRDNMNAFAVSFIAKIGLLALVRLVVVASAGNFATNASNTLIRLVYEAKAEWTLQEWLCYLEIKRAPAEFVVSMFSVYTVQQSSILVILGFALNYIVILLQTENYSGSGANATAANDSSAVGLLKNITEK